MEPNRASGGCPGVGVKSCVRWWWCVWQCPINVPLLRTRRFMLSKYYPNLLIYMVPRAGIEPARSQWSRDFKSLVSTNFTIWADQNMFKELEAGVGIEPAYTELQSAAWPLCHPAISLYSARPNYIKTPVNEHAMDKITASCGTRPQNYLQYDI